MSKILVAGATGYLGHHVLEELRAREYAVRALVRRPQQTERLKPLCDDVVVAQATDPATLTGVADGIDIVFSSIGITRTRDGFTYDAVDYRGNLNLLREAERVGVKRFVYVSVLHGRENRNIAVIDAKERFVDALERSTLSSCIVRPTGFFNDMAEFFEMARKGRVYLFGDGNDKLNPISGTDLARVCADAVASTRHEVEVGGPRVFTANEIAKLAFSALNRPPKIIHIPLWLAHSAFIILRAVTSQHTYGPIEMFLKVAGHDMVAPRHGADDLRDLFAKLAEDAENA